MTHRTLALALVAAAAVAACSDRNLVAEPETLMIPVFSMADNRADGNFGTHMTGAEETPPKPSLAQGQLVLRLDADGTALIYKLLVANIEDVTQAHIHLGAPGVAGPPIAWLYPAAPPAQLIPGPFNGVLSEGLISDANLVGPLAGQGVAALVETIRAGNAYANVHTSAYPPGEIRGQLAP